MADLPRWDLEPLVSGGGDDAARGFLAEAEAEAEEFAKTYRGKVEELDGEGLAEALAVLGGISDRLGRAGSYAALGYSVDSGSHERGALLAELQQRGAQIETNLLFFELEWAQVGDERAAEVLASPALDLYRHFLEVARMQKPHLMTEPEEKIATELRVTGRSAVARLFGDQISALRVDLPDRDEPVELDEALAELQSPDRSRREAAAGSITTTLEPGLKTRAYIFNTLLQDKATMDRLRSYPSWISSRNLSNEASDESVQALVEAVTNRYEIARRWYRLKAKLLGVDQLAWYDRAAPVGGSEREVPYEEAKSTVLDCYRGFSPEMADTAAAFFDGNYVDVPPAAGKRGGAFCSYTVPSAHPYVMLNYTAKPNDVLTLAHELGHGVHASLARPRGIFEFTTPLTVAETASTFGESIVLDRLLDDAAREEKLSLLAETIDGYVATTFRQIAMNRFEDRVHTARREEGEISTDRFASDWLATQTDLLGDSVSLDEAYGIWWSYIPHFIDSPGYVYAYAYGNLLALSVYRRYREEGPDFVPAYLDLNKAGGSRSPEGLGEIVGVDLRDPEFWNKGLDLIEERLDEAEREAEVQG
ncbi:MAG: M3 family oligoendopeptidase [bacterium]